MTRTLVVAEKFNTALRIAVVLSEGRMKRSRTAGTNVFEFERPEGPFAVVGLRGHIVELDYPKELSEWSLATLPKLLDAPPRSGSRKRGSSARSNRSCAASTASSSRPTSTAKGS